MANLDLTQFQQKTKLKNEEINKNFEIIRQILNEQIERIEALEG